MNIISKAIDYCKKKMTYSHSRSYGVGWEKARKDYIQANPRCEVCGYLSFENDVHHIVPRHIAPEKLLDRTNFITLCRKYNCHLRFGHFGNYRKYYNVQIREMFKGTGKMMWEQEIKIRKSTR